ncbi:MAG: fluoride efflux transporter CrcB [Pyrinomonadaceae bacterium]
METFLRYSAVAIGGAVGAMLRFFLGSLLVSRQLVPFPLATFVINITGSFVIGFFLTLATEKLKIDPYLRLMVAVGFVGAYTTFSTFEYETARLVEDKEWLYAFLNVVLSFTLGFAAVWGGIVAARELAGLPPASDDAYLKFEAQANPLDPTEREGVERDIRDSTIKAAEKRKKPRKPII